MLLCEGCSINSCGQNFPKKPEKSKMLKMEFIMTNWSKIRLLIYQFAFCCFFVGQLFKRSNLVSLFVLDYRKVPKHFLSFNVDESISTVLIKNGSLSYFNHMCDFWSWSLLSQLKHFKVLVIQKDLILFDKRLLFILFSFHLFLTMKSKEKC